MDSKEYSTLLHPPYLLLILFLSSTTIAAAIKSQYSNMNLHFSFLRHNRYYYYYYFSHYHKIRCKQFVDMASICGSIFKVILYAATADWPWYLLFLRFSSTNNTKSRKKIMQSFSLPTIFCRFYLLEIKATIWKPHKPLFQSLLSHSFENFFSWIYNQIIFFYFSFSWNSIKINSCAYNFVPTKLKKKLNWHQTKIIIIHIAHIYTHLSICYCLFHNDIKIHKTICVMLINVDR